MRENFSRHQRRQIVRISASVIVSLLLASFACGSAKTDEFVTIDQVRYKVPAPWAGHKMVTSSVVPENLVPVPKDFTENATTIYVTAATRDAIVRMLTRAREDGVTFYVRSGYRSVNYQKAAFRKRLKAGRSFNNVAWTVAPPGYSQHQLGTAVDFSVPEEEDFDRSAAYDWLREHAETFCFTESYPRYNLLVKWEPWHWNHHDLDQCFGCWLEATANESFAWAKSVQTEALRQQSDRNSASP